MFRQTGDELMRGLLEKAVLQGELREIDLHAALFMEKLAGGNSPELLLAAALTSRAVGEGHICLPLDITAGRQVFSQDIPCLAPDLNTWQNKLLASGVAGPDDKGFPLVLDPAGRLYLSRHFRCERMIANDLVSRSAGVVPVRTEEAAKIISGMFSDSAGEDWQKVAVAAAALKRFVVISGGPGTGKTYTVARILALQQVLSGGNLRIALAAPTGKAAVRLQESITNAKLSIDKVYADLVPVEAKTLHRLLGFNPGAGKFKYNRDNKLHIDLLVIDEASMIDVELMAALVQALPQNARLVLLGDRDQLTSVEAGSLFGDICSTNVPGWSTRMCEQVKELVGWAPQAKTSDETFDDSVVLLQKSYRFGEHEGIARLASIVNNGNGQQITALAMQEFDDLMVGQLDKGDMRTVLEEHIFAGFKQCFSSITPEEALAALSRFRILCAIRQGSQGVEGLNRLTEDILRQRGLIDGDDQWYKGRPLIIRNNHYELQLFNGDTGIVWPGDDGKLWAWFSAAGGDLHQVPLSRLPNYETAYAITVHQSQGSEFEEVLFMLPSADSRVLCRELIYTGITRARKKLMLFGDTDLLVKAVEDRVVRYSGLQKKLWKGSSKD